MRLILERLRINWGRLKIRKLYGIVEKTKDSGQELLPTLTRYHSPHMHTQRSRRMIDTTAHNLQNISRNEEEQHENNYHQAGMLEPK